MNPFDALAENDPTTDNEPAQKDSEHFKFTSIVPDAKITLQEEGQEGRLDPTRYPAEATLLACSSKFGYFVAGTPKGFTFGSTKAILKTLKSSEKGGTNSLDDKVTIPIDKGAVHHLRLSADERRIIVAIEGGHVLLYDAKDILQERENAQPKTSFQLAADILELRPNPDALPHIAAVRLKNNQSLFIDINTGSTTATIPRDDVTAMSWSPKGKQIVCGRKNGMLEHFDVQGEVKDSIEMPKELRENDPESRFVLAVLWIENHVFLAVYSKHREDEDDMYIHDPYIIDRKPKNSTEIRYMHLEEVTPVFGSDNRGSHMYIECIRNFSQEVRYVIILADNATSDVSVIGQDDSGEWATWLLPEGSEITMPLSEETNLDTFPKGLAIDYSVSEDLPPYDPAESSEGVKPVPMLMYLNDEDHIGAQYCYNEALAKRGEKYQGMVEAQNLLSPETEEPKQPAEQPKPEAPSAPAFGTSSVTSTAPATSSFPNSPFGSAIQNQGSTSFSDLLSGNAQGTKPAQTGFGASAGGFGASTGSSGFSFASLAKNTAPGAVAPSFGMKPAAAQTSATPTFGSTTAFGAAAGTPVFGSTTSFGAAASKPASSPFGAAATKTDTTPTFGSTTSFGALAQQQSGKSFGELLSGSGESKPAETTTTTTTTSTSGFKSSGGLSFASLAKNTAPGAVAPSFGMKPAAAPTSTTPIFGTTSFGAAPSSAAISEPEKKDTETKPTSLFGAASQKTEVAAKTPATTGFTFGQAKAETKTEETSAKPSTRFSFGQPLEPKADAAAAKKEEPTMQKEEEKAPAELEQDDISEKPETTAAKPATTGFSFGEAAQQKTESKPATTGFSFGKAVQQKAEPQPATTGFSFGAAAQAKPEMKPATTGFSFGAASEKRTEGTAPKAASTGFSFGAAKPAEASPKTSTAAATPEKSSGFGFGSFGANLPKVSSPLSSTTTSTKPAAATASAGFSFTPSPAKAEAAPKEHSKPAAPAPLAASPSTATPATTAKPKAEEKKPSRTPTAKEGMAREFEVAYLSVIEEFDKLEEKYKSITDQVQAQTIQQVSARTREDIQDPNRSWKIGDARSLGDLLDGIVSDAQKVAPKFQSTKQSIRYLEEDFVKLKAKIEEVKQYSEEGKEQDPALKKMLQERQVDEDSQEKWMRAEARSLSSEKLLENLERRLQEYKKKIKMRSNEQESFPSLYAMYRTLYDIEAELGTKQDTLREMEEKLAELRLKENSARVMASKSGFYADDDDDDEEEEKVISPSDSKVNNIEAPPWTDLASKQSAEHFQRARFLDKLCSTRRKVIRQTATA